MYSDTYGKEAVPEFRERPGLKLSDAFLGLGGAFKGPFGLNPLRNVWFCLLCLLPYFGGRL